MKRVLVLLSLAVAAPALAQNQPAAAPAAAPDYVPPAQRIDITDDEQVEGDFPRPGQEFVSSLRRAKHRSLIHIRYEFIDEMIKSVESF